MKIFTKAEAIASINTERPSQKALDHWLGSGDTVDRAMVKKFMSAAVVRLTPEMAMKCQGKTIYVWMGQFHLSSTETFTKGEKVKRLEQMKIVKYNPEYDDFLVEMWTRHASEKHHYAFEICDQMGDGLLRSGSGGEVVYAFLEDDEPEVGFGHLKVDYEKPEVKVEKDTKSLKSVKCEVDTDSLSSAMSKLEVRKQTLKEKLSKMSVVDLKKFCRERGFTGYSKLNKSELVAYILDKVADQTCSE